MAADGAGILLVEHNIPFVRATADRLVVLDLGRVIAAGGVDKVLADRRVVEAYLGTE
jgi:branched-chain amino acid transport system ATP-binding protein